VDQCSCEHGWPACVYLLRSRLRPPTMSKRPSRTACLVSFIHSGTLTPNLIFRPRAEDAGIVEVSGDLGHKLRTAAHSQTDDVAMRSRLSRRFTYNDGHHGAFTVTRCSPHHTIHRRQPRQEASMIVQEDRLYRPRVEQHLRGSVLLPARPLSEGFRGSHVSAYARWADRSRSRDRNST
jgi:hypothetical protein